MSDSVWPHRWQPTRLPCPWDSPGKNTRVGCHFLLQCMKVKSEREVAQSCLTPSDPMDCNLSGSSIHGICQARVLEWGAIEIRQCIMTLNYFWSLLKFNQHKYDILKMNKQNKMLFYTDFIMVTNIYFQKQYNFEYKNAHWMQRFVTELCHNIRWVFFRFAFVAVCFI